MNVLVTSAEPDWETWIARVLVPVAEAFGFRVIRLSGPGDPKAYNAFREAAAAELSRARAHDPPGVLASGDDRDLPYRVLGLGVVRPALIRSSPQL